MMIVKRVVKTLFFCIQLYKIDKKECISDKEMVFWSMIKYDFTIYFVAFNMVSCGTLTSFEVALEYLIAMYFEVFYMDWGDTLMVKQPIDLFFYKTWYNTSVG